MLAGKCIVLGVTGGIAAYKAAYLASALHKSGATVHVVMTKNAREFITPLTFETLTGQRCITNTFDRDFSYDVKHVSLAKAADLILIAPATANCIAKLAHGIADDMLTTLVLAARCRKLVAPAMNTAMLENPITADNLKTLERYGFEIIPADTGRLACGDVGKGKMPEPEEILPYVYRALAREKTLAGVRVTVTAGPTREPLDPVRFLSNRSSGKMGYAIAREAMLRGAEVTLIHGPTSLAPVPFVKHCPVTCAEEMLHAVQEALPETDILVKAAAVADYRPEHIAGEKLKKKEDKFQLSLLRTDDILEYVAAHRHPGLYVCGFSMETENLLENSRAKLEKKKLDMIAANSLREEGAGFAVDTNRLTLLTKDKTLKLPLLSKEEAAERLLQTIEQDRESKT